MMKFRVATGDGPEDAFFKKGDLIMGVTTGDWDEIYDPACRGLTDEFKEWMAINSPLGEWTLRRAFENGMMGDMETILILKFSTMAEVIHFKMRYQKGS